MSDIIYPGIALLFFLMTWGLLRLCDRLMNDESERKS